MDESTLAHDKRHRLHIVEDGEAMLVTFEILQVCKKDSRTRTAGAKRLIAGASGVILPT